MQNCLKNAGALPAGWENAGVHSIILSAMGTKRYMSIKGFTAGDLTGENHRAVPAKNVSDSRMDFLTRREPES